MRPCERPGRARGGGDEQVANLLKAVDKGRTPLFIRVYQLLRKRLEAGEWVLGAQVPTIEQLMAEYDVSRATIREALSQLEREGLISRSRGRGTHVTGTLKDERWLILPTDWHGLVKHIDSLDARVEEIESGPGTPRLAAGEGIAARAYWRARRVNYSQKGAPYSLTTILLARDVFRQTPRMFSRKAILPILASIRHGAIVSARQRMMISTADVDTAGHLEIEVGAPVAEVRRVACDADDRVIYLADILYPARNLVIETTLL